jgi:hypothetical protein
VSRARPFFAPRGRSPLERFARGLLVLGVFALAVAAYQWYFARLAAKLAARGTVADSLAVLDKTDRTWLQDQAAGLKARFGLVLTVRLGGGARALRPGDPKAVAVYFDPECKHGSVVVPPLVASALPGGFAADLGQQLDAACREGHPREGVLGAVGLLSTSLGEAASRGKGEGS